MPKIHWRLGLLLASTWLGFCRPVTAATPGSHFHVDAWEAGANGLPQNSVVAMVQTHDGYLWLGTLNGLVRFDGVQFKVFDEHNTPGLTSGRIVFLFEDSKTNLWIGTETDGALLLRDGRITNLGFGQGRREGRLRAACEDSTGAVWLRAYDGALARYRDGKLDGSWIVGAGDTLAAEKSGLVWIGTDHGLLGIDPAAVRGSAPLPIAQASAMSDVDFLLANKNGGRWCLGRDGADYMVEKWVGQGLEKNLGPYPWPLMKSHEISAVCEDLNGNLIVGTENEGIWWFDAAGKATQISRKNGLTRDSVLSLLMDRDGSLWVGLDGGGLNRLKPQLFQPLDAAAGLTVQSVCEDDQGRLWFSSPNDGVDYWSDDVLKTARVKLPGRADLGPMKDFDVRALLAENGRTIWAATLSAGLFCWKNGRFQPAPGIEAINGSVSALHQDRRGRLWAGTQGGLACWDGTNWQVFTKRDGLSSDIIRAIADDADANVWIGTEGGGLNCLKDGKFTSFQHSNGFPSDNISALYVDHDGVLWVGTFGNGLVRFQSGHWVNYTTGDGLNSNGVDYIIEDDEGCLWIGSNAGLMRVKKSALNDFAAGKLDFVPCRTFGQRDGLPSSECTQGSQPAACQARDGTLWFPTISGLASIDPSLIATNTSPLPVIIESVSIEGRPLTTNGPDSRAPEEVVVPPGTEWVDIDYTGLNLDEPQQARFRYRMMEGGETNWVNAGRSRTAHFSKLAPGNYTFQVTACNEDGIWAPPLASLAVTVLPAFWQTLWFRAAFVAVILCLVTAVVYLISTQRLQRQLEGMRQHQALEKDRARIARDIHDQVGASLTQLSLLGEMVESDKDNPEEVQTHAGQISQTARETARALDEIVWTVNPSNDTLEGLVNYICKHAQEYLAVAGLRYRLEAPAQLPGAEISPEARHNVFLAAKESVTNVVKHARATEVCIRLRLEPRSFTVEIEDNGRGPEGMTGAAAQGRNGLRNMRKRMEDIGGTFEIRPGSNKGTLVRLTVPLKS